jgi:hypothetical protein
MFAGLGVAGRGRPPRRRFRWALALNASGWPRCHHCLRVAKVPSLPQAACLIALANVRAHVGLCEAIAIRGDLTINVPHPTSPSVAPLILSPAHKRWVCVQALYFLDNRPPLAAPWGGWIMEKPCSSAAGI